MPESLGIGRWLLDGWDTLKSHTKSIRARQSNHVENFKGKAVSWMSLTSYYQLVKQYHCEYHTKISEAMMPLSTDYVVWPQWNWLPNVWRADFEHLCQVQIKVSCPVDGTAVTIEHTWLGVTEWIPLCFRCENVRSDFSKRFMPYMKHLNSD